MQRRRLLQIGIASATLLAVAGGGLSMFRPGLVGGRLSDGGLRVFRAVARAVLDGSLPTDLPAQSTALDAHLVRVGDTIAGFPAATRDELSQLLALLAAAPGRLALAGLGTDWADASVEQTQKALQGMRTSSLALRMQAYHALRDLTNAAFYADPAAWPGLGYPGPRTL